jgi:hypothetical protein
MSRALQKGQRFRVTERNRVAGYQPGDKGSVLRASVMAATGARYDTVAIDKDDLSTSGAVFTEGEIERDDES